MLRQVLILFLFIPFSASAQGPLDGYLKGSNNWAVSGSRAAAGSAMFAVYANDSHLQGFARTSFGQRPTLQAFPTQIIRSPS